MHKNIQTNQSSPCFSGLISTTSSIVFLAARILYVCFFTAVHIYEFHISKIIIHHLDDVFGPNILTSSELACQVSWQSSAPVSQWSWVQIQYGPEFFSGLISTTSSVVFLAVRISYICYFTAVHIYEFDISKIIFHHLDGLFGPNIWTSSQLVCQLSWQSAAPVLQRSWVQILYRP